MARKSIVPDPELDVELIDGLYNPEYVPDKLALSEFVREEVIPVEETKKTLESKTIEREPGEQGPTPGVPLTPDEAELANQQIDETLERLDAVRTRIQSVRTKVDEQVKAAVAASNKSELSFGIDISKNPALRRAVKKVFGYKTNVITYSMYKELLAAKRLLEQKDARGYVKGYDDAV